MKITKEKKPFIKMCLNCKSEKGCYTPHFYPHGRYYHVCKVKDDREIKDATTIPSWCLGNYKNVNN